MTIEGSKDHTTTIVIKARSEKVIGIFSGIIEVIKLYHTDLFIKTPTKELRKSTELFVTAILKWCHRH